MTVPPDPGDRASRDDRASEGDRAPADDRFAARLRGFGPVGIAAFLVILAGNLLVTPLTALFVLVWRHLSRTPWRDIGYAPPRRWWRTIALGVVLGIALKLVLKAVVMPLLGAPDINPHFQHLVGNTAALPAMLFLSIVVAGFGEETFFRGYLFERLGKLFGRGTPARAFTVLVTAALFGLAHIPEQGRFGAEQATIVGLVYGTIFAVTGRIWMLMAAHAAFDVTATAVIYWNLESKVAHLVFK